MNRRKRIALRSDGYAVVPDRSGARQPHQGRREHAPGSRFRERTHFRNGIFAWRAASGAKQAGVTTTAAGDALIRHARLILDQVEQMRGELRTYGTGLKGRIRLLSNTAGLAAFLPYRLDRFLVTYPDLSIDLNEWPSTEIAVAIAEGRADLGVVADIADLAALQTRVIAQDQLVVVVSETHRISDQRSIAFADVVSEPFVGLSDAALEAHLGERAARLGRQIYYRIQLRRIEHVAMLVESGVGIAILSEASAKDLGHLGLAIVPLRDPWALRQLHLCARDFSALTPHASLLAQQLMEPKVAIP